MPINALINELKENNQDYEFYPTTKEIIKVIYENTSGGEFLDIGCGTCNFKKYFQELEAESRTEYNRKNEIYINSNYKNELRPNDKYARLGAYYVIEKSTILLNKLDNETIVLGTDFNSTMLMDKPVKNIFCNPPYSEFKEWTIRIILEANCKNIFLVIPVRWKENQDIQTALEKTKSEAKILGTFDFLNAERNARTKVDAIKITRQDYREYNRYEDDYGNFYETAFDEWFNKTFFIKQGSYKNEWTFEEEKRNEIRNKLAATQGSKAKILVDLYNEEMATLFEHFKAISSLDIEVLETIGVKKEAVKLALKKKATGTKARYWKLAFEELDEITSRLTSHSRNDMLHRFTGLQSVDFTIENIYALVLWVIKNANKYYNEQLISFFKDLSSPDNIKNYKSNYKVFARSEWRHSRFDKPEEISHYTLDYRIIMASPFDTDCRGRLETGYKSDECLQDIFTIAKNLGFNIGLCDIPKNFGEKCTVLYERSNKIFMEYRVYKNRNMHVKFDIEFAKALNVECSRLLGWIGKKEDIQKEFTAEIAQGAERYFKHNYTCIGSNSLFLADMQNSKKSEFNTKEKRQIVEYSISNLILEAKTTDLKYILDVMNLAINNEKETEKIYNKCLNVLKTGNQFIYRQIVVTVEQECIILTINNKQTLNKIVSIIKNKEQ